MKTSSNAAKKGNSAYSSSTAQPKLPCRVTVTESGWHGAKQAAIAAGCSSVSDLLEKLGNGELSVIESDAIALDPIAKANQTLMGGKRFSKGEASPTHRARKESQGREINPRAIAAKLIPSGVPESFSQGVLQQIPQHIHIHTGAEIAEALEDEDLLTPAGISLPKLIFTGVCAAGIIGSLLYVADQILTNGINLSPRRERVEDIVTPKTGDVVAGYTVSDEYGIRPIHPVTGEPNAPHSGVDLATPVGTPIYAIGEKGDRATVDCWWDDGGGGWVVDQTASLYPGYTFQSLHTSENGCRQGKATAGEVIAFSGKSGLGTGEHYDFRVKIDGEYVPPDVKYLEAAVTGKLPAQWLEKRLHDVMVRPAIHPAVYWQTNFKPLKSAARLPASTLHVPTNLNSMTTIQVTINLQKKRIREREACTSDQPGFIECFSRNGCFLAAIF